MKAHSLFFCLVLLSGCWASTPEEQKKEDELFYRGKSTRQNVTSDLELRSLVPVNAIPYDFKFPQEADFWHVDDTLANTLRWYKDTLEAKGFRGTLRQCSEHGIFGGRVVIVDFCSADTAVTVNLFEDTAERKTALSVSMSPRRPSYRCDDPDLAEVRKVWTANCPAELTP